MSASSDSAAIADDTSDTQERVFSAILLRPGHHLNDQIRQRPSRLRNGCVDHFVADMNSARYVRRTAHHQIVYYPYRVPCLLVVDKAIVEPDKSRRHSAGADRMFTRIVVTKRGNA